MSEPEKGRHGKRVRRSFLALLAALVTFVVAAFLLTVYGIERQTREADFEAKVNSVNTLLAQKVAASAGLMHAVVMTMANSERIATAFGAGDREALLTIVEPLYLGLRRDHGITHLYFTRPDLVNLVRVHDRGHWGDVIDRATTRRAAETSANAYGIELGPMGTVTLRSVTPWLLNGRVIGYLELGKDIEPILADTASSLGLRLFALVEGRLLKPDAWEYGRRLMGRPADWPEFGDYVLAGRSDPLVDQPTAALLRDALVEDGPGTKVAGGRFLAFSAVPLKDAGGRAIGKLVVLSDRTEAQATFRRWLVLATGLSVAAAALVFTFFHRALQRVEDDYRHQHELEQSLLRISSEHERLLQIEKLSAMGTMIGEIAHQLNNPLVGVVNMAQLAERAADKPDRVRQLLGEIQKAGKDCSTFVKRMLDFTKVSRFDCRPSDLRGVVDEALALFQHSVGRRTIIDKTLPDHPVELAVDPILLSHALFNLLSNAAQAMGGGGRLALSLRPGGGVPGWELVVEDEGPGLSEEVRNRLFTPFFTTRADGTGLGLPVVLHIVLLHGGQVRAENREAGGARFAIWLPSS